MVFKKLVRFKSPHSQKSSRYERFKKDFIDIYVLFTAQSKNMKQTILRQWRRAADCTCETFWVPYRYARVTRSNEYRIYLDISLST